MDLNLLNDLHPPYKSNNSSQKNIHLNTDTTSNYE